MIVKQPFWLDAAKYFSSLNHLVVLHNIQHHCSTPNFYHSSELLQIQTELFVDGNSILSLEGTTQGDLLAMSMHDLATIPLIPN